METTMGLDMYAFALTQLPAAEVDFPSIGRKEQIHYWRKHPDLHGWMERLYRAKGGQRQDFNCTPVVLTSNDLDQLEQDIHRQCLPFTDGCFFGESNGSEQDDDLLFVSKAREAIAAGKAVVYTSWW
jgi:hypothetical protein